MASYPSFDLPFPSQKQIQSCILVRVMHDLTGFDLRESYDLWNTIEVHVPLETILSEPQSVSEYFVHHEPAELVTKIDYLRHLYLQAYLPSLH